MRLGNLESSPIKNLDWTIPSIMMLLTAVSLLLIYSATVHMGELGRTYVARQILWTFLAVLMVAAFLLFDYSFLDKWAVWLYIALIVSLIIVWGLGKVTAGSRRWIEIGFMRLQPSEFAKPIIVIVLAHFLSRVENSSLSISDLVKAGLIVLLPAMLVLAQPDLGTALVILFIGGSVIIFRGIGRKSFLWLMSAIAIIGPVLYFLSNRILLAYQKKRIMTFLNPEADPLGAGYHILQSQIAIGNGGAFGSGFLKGTQNQLTFLPVKHTDFIFSILAEEWGFAGCVFIFILFGLLFYRGLAAVSNSRSEFGALISFGCICVIFWHFFINIGMVMGLLPVVGVPLSFISYGGSSLLASYFCIGVLLNTGMRRYRF